MDKAVPHFKCPICEHNIEAHGDLKGGERITCPNCFAQLAMYKHRGQIFIGCAICKESIFDPGNCENCESRREKKKILEEGRL